jgi:hypothetical protein
MKKVILIVVMVAAMFQPAKAGWTYKYYYCPVSWSEAKVYFQYYIGTLTLAGHIVYDEHDEIYIGGEGALPDSNEDNTIEFPFQYLYGHLDPPTIPWRKDAKNHTLLDGGVWGSTHTSNDVYCITIERGITHIGNWWFADLSKLREILGGPNFQSIGEGVFKGCSELSIFSCSDNLKNIGNRAFEDCSSLPEFKVYDPTGNYKISDKPLNIGEGAFRNCKSLQDFNFTNGSTIGNRAFEGSGIKSIELRPGISFGDYVFNACPDLESVVIQNNAIFGEYILNNCQKLTSVILQTGINTITNGMFYDCISLKSIDIPNSVTSIGDHAFYASGLTSIDIPNSVTSIGDYAFSDHSTAQRFYLTSVTIPNSVTRIGEAAFSYTGLTEIVIPGSVKSIESGAFTYCPSLKTVRLCEGVKTIDYVAFQDASNLEKVSLPASLDSIGEWAFGWDNNLKVIECNGTTPPAMHSYVFYGSNIAGTSLCVPYGSVEAYRNAPVWKEFKHIGTYPAGIHILSGKDITANSNAKIKLTAKLLPNDAVPTVIWTSSNKNVATVEDGIVTTHSSGEAIITATTFNEVFKDECKITVKLGNDN